MKRLTALLTTLLVSLVAFADTPPPGVITLRGATDATHIGNVADALKVNVVNTSGGSSTVIQGNPNAGGALGWWVQQVGTWNFNLPTGAATSALQTTIDTDLLSFKSANHTDLGQIDTDVLGFKTANHTDLLGINALITTLNGLVATSANQVQLDTDLLSFKSANHADLGAINTSIGSTNAALGSIASSMATAANQVTANNSLASIDAKLTAPLLVTVASAPLAANAATASNQASQIALETSIAANQTSGGQKTQVISIVPTSDYVASGALSSTAGSVSIVAAGVGEIGVNVSGSFVGSLQVQGIPPGPGTPANLSTLQSGVWTTAPITAPGFYKVATVPGYSSAQVVFTAYTSGTATIAMEGSPIIGTPTVRQGNAANLNATVVQATGSNLHVNVDNLPATQPISGNVGLLAGSNLVGGVQIVDSAGTNKLAVGTAGNLLVSGASPVGAAPTLNPVSVSAVDQAGNKQHFKVVTGTNALIVDGSATTQPVSATALPLPAGAATSANQATSNASLATIATNTANPPVKLQDGSGNAITSSANGFQRSLDVQLHDNSGNAFQGQQNMAGSIPVAIASNQSAIPITASALPLPASAATSANQASEIAVLNTIATNTGAQNTDITTTGTITALNGAVSISAQGVYTTTFSITGTWSATLVVEGQTPDSNWTAIPINIITSALPYQQVMTITSNGTYAVSAGGFTNIRVRASAFTSGTVAAAIDGSLAQQTVIANINTPDLTVTGASAQTATVNNILTPASGTASTFVGGFHSGSIQVVSTGTAGTFIFEGSNDNVNFQTIPVYSQLILTGTPITAAITATASQLVYTFPIQMNYIRLRIATTITGGSIQAFSRFSQAPWSPAVMQVAQATAANNNVTATIGSGTVTTVTTLTTLANGQTAHSAASTGSPVRVGGRVVTALDTTLATGDASDLLVTTGQQLVTKDFATSENDWQYTNAFTTTTTATAAKAAGAASIRNFWTGVCYQNTSATATTVLIQDGATTIWQANAPASMSIPACATFPTPLRGTAATAANVNFGTAGATVLFNAQGYQSF